MQLKLILHDHKLNADIQVTNVRMDSRGNIIDIDGLVINDPSFSGFQYATGTTTHQGKPRYTYVSCKLTK